MTGTHRHFEFFWYPTDDLAHMKVLQPTDLFCDGLPDVKGERIDWSWRIFPTVREKAVQRDGVCRPRGRRSRLLRRGSASDANAFQRGAISDRISNVGGGRFFSEPRVRARDGDDFDSPRRGTPFPKSSSGRPSPSFGNTRAGPTGGRSTTSRSTNSRKSTRSGRRSPRCGGNLIRRAGS